MRSCHNVLFSGLFSGLVAGGLLACGLAACTGKRADDAFHRPSKSGVHVQLCAAYPYEPQTTGAVVIDRNGSAGDVLTFHDHQFNVHRTDCLALDAGGPPDVQWRIDHDIAFVGITPRGDAAGRIGPRSEQRMSQYDALFVGDTLVTVADYRAVLDDTFWISNRDHATERALFETLTGVKPATGS